MPDQREGLLERQPDHRQHRPRRPLWNQQARDEGWDGQCFDANEAGIYVNGCNDGDNQRWY
ncbi:hypothetical protein [Streptomyces sp. HUAS TT7]|uniref:hypothetical protein n=1 Tax=Streptomyces sp. HUAS TT7 TaxID=3447507 RepID=UPI003F654A8B